MANGERLLRDFLEIKINQNIIPLNALKSEWQDIVEYDYFDLRKYLQEYYLPRLALKKKEEMYRTAEANKAFAHFA
jgi:hypothetical protein